MQDAYVKPVEHFGRDNLARILVRGAKLDPYGAGWQVRRVTDGGGSRGN